MPIDSNTMIGRALAINVTGPVIISKVSAKIHLFCLFYRNLLTVYTNTMKCSPLIQTFFDNLQK